MGLSIQNQSEKTMRFWILHDELLSKEADLTMG